MFVERRLESVSVDCFPSTPLLGGHFPLVLSKTRDAAIRARWHCTMHYLCEVSRILLGLFVTRTFLPTDVFAVVLSPLHGHVEDAILVQDAYIGKRLMAGLFSVPCSNHAVSRLANIGWRVSALF